jgi:hypothetical protein
VKFSVKSIYPISTSSQATQCLGSWEFAAGDVENLFMGEDSQYQGQKIKGTSRKMLYQNKTKNHQVNC